MLLDFVAKKWPNCIKILKILDCYRKMKKIKMKKSVFKNGQPEPRRKAIKSRDPRTKIGRSRTERFGPFLGPRNNFEKIGTKKFSKISDWAVRGSLIKS